MKRCLHAETVIVWMNWGPTDGSDLNLFVCSELNEAVARVGGWWTPPHCLFSCCCEICECGCNASVLPLRGRLLLSLGFICPQRCWGGIKASPLWLSPPRTSCFSLSTYYLHGSKLAPSLHPSHLSTSLTTSFCFWHSRISPLLICSLTSSPRLNKCVGSLEKRVCIASATAKIQVAAAKLVFLFGCPWRKKWIDNNI